MVIENSVITVLKSLFDSLYLKDAYNYLKQKESSDKKISDKKIINEINNFIQKYNRSYFYRFRNGSLLKKYYIVSVSIEWNCKNQPCIVINKLNDDSGYFKDNPIKNLYIVYDNVEDRDFDFEKLIEELM